MGYWHLHSSVYLTHSLTHTHRHTLIGFASVHLRADRLQIHFLKSLQHSLHLAQDRNGRKTTWMEVVPLWVCKNFCSVAARTSLLHLADYMLSVREIHLVIAGVFTLNQATLLTTDSVAERSHGTEWKGEGWPCGADSKQSSQEEWRDVVWGGWGCIVQLAEGLNGENFGALRLMLFSSITWLIINTLFARQIFQNKTITEILSALNSEHCCQTKSMHVHCFSEKLNWKQELGGPVPMVKTNKSTPTFQWKKMKKQN